jgi:sugar/nucleoside kinase (ribokinase family)
MHDLGPKIVLITDGPNGAYAYENGNFWFMPIYPDPKPAYERTGAGDAFASTFVSALALGKNVEEALRWAPINSMSVVQYVGAQKGLLDQKSIELYDKNSPDSYRIKRL